MKAVLWTRGYRPFIMGGNVNAPLGVEIEVLPVDLGKKFKGYIAVTPKGKTMIAEATTGAIVGTSLEEVKKDIQEGDLKTMKQQVKDAAEMKKRMEILSFDEFMKYYDR